MSQRATVNPIKVPYTPVKCPVCHVDYKEHNPRKKVDEGRPHSKCPEGHLNTMDIYKANNTLIVSLQPANDAERKTNRSQVS